MIEILLLVVLFGQLAVADLSKAAKLSPDDETVNDALKYCFKISLVFCFISEICVALYI